MQRVPISTTQKQQFWQQGYLALTETPLIAFPRLLSGLKRSLADCFEGKFSTGVYPDEWHWRAGISRDSAVREICNAWKSDHTVRSVVLNAHVGEIAGRLYDHWKSVRLGQDDILWKVPSPRFGKEKQDGGNASSGSQVGFHTDGEYISDQFLPKENNALTIWIALDDADEGNGCLEYVEGSHKANMERKERGETELALESDNKRASLGSSSGFHVADEEGDPDGQKANMIRTLENFADPGEKLHVAMACIPAGCCVVHHQETLHGSGRNMSDTRHRRAVVAHVIQGEVRFDVNPGYIYGRYKLDDTDMLRNEFFPKIWERE